MEIKKCGNCKHRCFSYWGEMDYCIDYTKAATEAEEIKNASCCQKYEFGIPSCLEDRGEYYSSATCGDYSPSNPWDAPGMSVKGFI